MTDLQPIEEEDAPDLSQMLELLSFGHWHSLLMDMCSRFDGWIVDYLQAPESSPDYRPLVDIMKVLREFPEDQAGDDLAMAKALAECDFLVRAARDRWRGFVCWDPFAEPYSAFAQRFPDRYPYWDARPARGYEQLKAWMLTQLQRAAGSASGFPTQS